MTFRTFVSPSAKVCKAERPLLDVLSARTYNRSFPRQGMRTICARDKCTRLFTPETRRWKGRYVDILSCPSCRARNSRYMRKRRAAKAGSMEGKCKSTLVDALIPPRDVSGR